jgi:hypothetical protein
MVPKGANSGCEIGVIGGDYTPFASGNRLTGMEAEAPGPAPGSRSTVVKRCADCTGGILEHWYPISSPDLEELWEISHCPKCMNGDDRLHIAPISKAVFEPLGIHVEGARLDVDEDRISAT